METTTDGSNNQSDPKARSKPLPGGGSLSLVRAPNAHDNFLKAMDLRRGAVDTPMDEKAALELLEISAKQDHLGASAALALLCDSKLPTEVSDDHFKKAQSWIVDETQAGNEWGLLFTGVMYFDGQRVEQSYEEAAHYFKLAADQGNACAQGFLGYLHSVGQGVLLNRQEAVSYYRAAADQGHVVAQFDMGVSYAQGRGVPKDKKAAVSWFTLAGERGDLQARALLAKMYAVGNIVEQDNETSVMWFRRAAEGCLLYTSPSPRDATLSRMPSSA